MRRIDIANVISLEMCKESKDKFFVSKKYTDKILKKFIDHIINTINEGGRVEFRGFGVFSSVIRKPKIGRNPRKPGIEVIIPEKKAMKFAPSLLVSKVLNKK